MTPSELKSAAAELYGERYEDALAGLLRRNRVQIWRYVSGRAPIPHWVEALVRAELERRKKGSAA